MSVLVVGTVALDTVQSPFGKVKDTLGGSAAYFAVAASCFAKVKLVSIVGDDFPRKFITFLQTRGIDIKGLQIKAGKTFRWSGRYSYNLNSAETLKTELNLLAHFNPILPAEYKNEEFVFLANIDPQAQLKVLRQLKGPKLVACDTMNYWIEHEKEALKRVFKKSDIVILNDSEAREFSRQSNLVKAAKMLLGLGPRLVIVKRGEYGCSLFSRSFSFYLPAYLLEKAQDPTGAGDTFAGGFLGYLASCRNISEFSFKKAVVFGTIMASYTVEDFSLKRLKKVTGKDIKARFRNFQRVTRF